MTVLVDAVGVSTSRADRILFADLSVTVTERDRLGVVGINGTGKSTLLRVLAGTQTPESGQVHFGRSTRIGVLDQDAILPSGTIGDAIGGGWESEAILDRMGMATMLDVPVSNLSGGQAKRVALTRVLANPAELLILDEPTNQLDIPAVSWLEEWLSRYNGGVILVSHDRYLLDRVTTRMIELDRGRAYIHNGGYAGYLSARAEREEKSADAESTRQNLARRELAWLRRGARARTRKPQARIDAAHRLLGSAPEAPARASPLDIGFDTPRLGNSVIELKQVSFAHAPKRDPVFADVSLSLSPRERLGVVGANGSGKSTLLEVLAGHYAPSSGEVKQGLTVTVGYYTQKPTDFNPEARVRDVVAGPSRAPGHLVDQRLMERFWFKGELPWATVGTLSGGERRRLQLLTVLASRPNVLLLDEPTNDLDLDTLRTLEDFLEDWPGAVVTVSHDRVFLERVTDRIVVCGERQISEIPGGLTRWIAKENARGVRPPSQKVDPPQVQRAASHPHPAQTAGGRRRSGSTIGYSLRQTEKELARLAQERDLLAKSFEAAVDHRDLTRIGSELATIQALLSDSEERWLALAEEAEAR